MFHVTLINPDQHEELSHDRGPLELGRAPREDVARLTVNDEYISRRQLRLLELPDGRVQVDNLGADVVVSDGTTLRRGAQHYVRLPATLTRGHTRIELSPQQSADAVLHTIAEPIRGAGPPSAPPLERMGQAPRPEQLAQWFETLLSVQKSAAGSRAFYAETAAAVVELVGMDRGLVILRDAAAWKVVASHTTPHADGMSDAYEYSRTVLARVLEQKRTYYETAPDADVAVSLASIQAYVASPIFGDQDQVIGVVFGSRHPRPGAAQPRIQPLEAQVVQLLASAVSAGNLRLEQQAEAARLQVQLQQFASPELVRELQRQPDLLQPAGREVTVLFGDLRGFSRISEQLSPQDTFRLVSDAMERLTACIAEHGGYVIDYSGDGIGAMWNAPARQPDHAPRAAAAAADMLAQMPALSDDWRDKLGQPLRLGIGLNTGPVQVGNAGSQRRLKYSPLGHHVNLASRVEGATKQLGVACLVTDATRAAIRDHATAGPTPAAFRRLCRVRVVGIQQPVTLHELRPPPTARPVPTQPLLASPAGVPRGSRASTPPPASPDGSGGAGPGQVALDFAAWREFIPIYEAALEHYENYRPAETLRLLDGCDRDAARIDPPAVRLRRAAEDAAGQTPYDPVWNLDQK